MNQVLDASPSSTPLSQSIGRQGLGLELTNQRSVSSVLTKATEYNLHPQQIADAGLQVISSSTHFHDSSVAWGLMCTVVGCPAQIIPVVRHA